MPKYLDPTNLVNAYPFKPLQKLGKGEGRRVSALGLSFKWKIVGDDTGYAFACYEMEIDPGTGIPLHVHPFAEFFYVLEGEVEAVGLDASGSPTTTPVSAGESAFAPINSPHGLRNKSSKKARFLSVANFDHEQLFNRFEKAMKNGGASQLSEQQQAELFLEISAKGQAYSLAT